MVAGGGAQRVVARVGKPPSMAATRRTTPASLHTRPSAKSQVSVDSVGWGQDRRRGRRQLEGSAPLRTGGLGVRR